MQKAVLDQISIYPSASALNVSVAQTSRHALDDALHDRCFSNHMCNAYMDQLMHPYD